MMILVSVGNMSLSGLLVVSLFVEGFQPKILKSVAMFKPKILWDAYCLARLEESTNNDTKKSVNPPLLPYPNLQDSSEIRESTNCLMTLDKPSEVGKNNCVDLPPSPKPCKLFDERSKIESSPQHSTVFGSWLKWSHMEQITLKLVSKSGIW